MSVTEEVRCFGSNKSLTGIVTLPQQSDRRHDLPAILFLNAGLVHRVGPNRLYVRMARHLAARGFVTLRFDFSGIGDSEPRGDRVPYPASCVAETQEAMNLLSQTMSVKRFVLMGICGGALISYKTACRDPRVAGAVLISPRGLEYGAREKMWKYVASREVLDRLLRPRSWLRAITGKSEYLGNLKMLGRRLRGAFQKDRSSCEASDASAELCALIERGVELFVVYPASDYCWDYLKSVFGEAIHEMSATGTLRVEAINNANHVFTAHGSHSDLQKAVDNWLQGSVNLTGSAPIGC